ncbi:MAG: M28 family peptidase [Balneolaceae bacterium]|nr:M28 family peptidase [Balneolaceae bacterium]
MSLIDHQRRNILMRYIHFFRGFLLNLVLLALIPFPAKTQTTELSSNTDQLLEYQQQIHVNFLKQHLSVLAHDSLAGRETGTEGQKIAAKYLARQYEQMGLTAMGDEGSYFQNFELSAVQRDSTVFKLYDGGGLVDHSVESQNATGNFIRAFGGADSLSGNIIFAGFGINDPANGVIHLGDMKLEGKWVLVFQQIPHIVEGDTLIDTAINGNERFRSIIQKGAEGVLIIAPMKENEFEASAQQMAQLSYAEPQQLSLTYLNENSVAELPQGYNTIKPSLAADILGIPGGINSLEEYRQELIRNITEFSPTATGYSLSHTPHTSRYTVDTENVVAMMEGSDPQLKDEVVVLTSHYDHVGIGQPDSTGDTIYNGADDDGSGTVALLNIAKAINEAKADGYAPKRSILFLHVSAEEIGLLGSRYYSDHPVIPMDKTVANINIDMIGRIDPEHEKEGISRYAYIIGSELISSELDSLLKTANAQSGQIELDKTYNDLNDPNQFYRRSDHWNFGRLRVPFIFFFSGVHEDYHRPSDEIHKIRFDKMADIIQTIYATTVVVANEETPPEVDNEAFIDITKTTPK